jgi:hypothetical protein
LLKGERMKVRGEAKSIGLAEKQTLTSLLSL